MVYLVLIIAELIALYFFSRKVYKLLGGFLYYVTRSQKTSIYLLAIIYLPGTFLHEVAHFLTALLLFVYTEGFDLIPEFRENEVSLGRVPHQKVGPVRNTLIGIAPLFFGIATIVGGLYLLLRFGLLENTIILILSGYLVFTISNSMFLNRTDMQGSIELFAILFGIGVILFLFGIQIPYQFLFQGGTFEVIKNTSYFLGAPIAVDVLAFLALNLTYKVAGIRPT